MKRYVSALLLYVIVFGIVFQGRGTFVEVLANTGCIPSGTETAINNALSGGGAKAVLCQDAVFTLNASINFKANNQEIYTDGYPTDEHRAVLRIMNKDVINAISSWNLSGLKVKNIIVDGNMSQFGMPPPCINDQPNNPPGCVLNNQRHALILLNGSTISNNTIDHVKAYGPRGWSTIVMSSVSNPSACTNGTITNNEVGPSGVAYPVGPWADGISFFCKNTIVENNVITDATDGGIVFFGASGSRIANNVVRAEKSRMELGIGGADATDDGDSTGLVIENNYIDAAGAFIASAIPVGSYTWYCNDTPLIRGVSVLNNVMTGAYMGYGISIDGTTDTNVTGNITYAYHSGTPVDFGNPKCGGAPATPAPFQRDSVHSTGTFTPNIDARVYPQTVKFQNALLHGIYGLQQDPLPANLNYAHFVSQSVPTALTIDAPVTFTITLKNTGTSSWSTAKNMRLGSLNPQDNTIWSPTARIELQPSETIAPGQSKTFTFSTKAPSVPGTYAFQWRMVQDGVQWFGDVTPALQVVVTNPVVLCPEDVKVDGFINILDLAFVGLRIGTKSGEPGFDPVADINKDGVISILDLVKIGLKFGTVC